MSEEKHAKQTKSSATVAVADDGKHKNEHEKSMWHRRSTWIVVLLFVLVGAGLAWAKAATTTYSLWANTVIPKTISDPDTSSVELGTRFQSKYAGQVTGVKFYKSAQNTGTHTGSLWDNNGNRLATVTFTNETASGWQTANFAQPINIAANVNYVISYHAPKGHYSDDTSYFAHGLQNGPLLAGANTSSNPNGVYVYSTSAAFPTHTYNSSSYYVDVVYQTNLINPTAKPAPPTTVTATQQGNSVVVNWNAAISQNLLVKYRVYRNGNYLLAVGSKSLTYTDTNISAGQTYTYQVKSVDSNNTESVLSVAATVTYNAVPPPTCPPGQVGTPPNCAPQQTGGGGGSGGTVAGWSCGLNAAAETCYAQHTGYTGALTAVNSDVKINSTGMYNLGTGALIASPSGKDSNGRSVYANYNIAGCVQFASGNVALNNSYIHSGNDCDRPAGDTSGAGSALVTTGGTESLIAGGVAMNSDTLDGTDNQGIQPTYSKPCLSATNFTGTLLNIRGCVITVWPYNDFSLNYSYVHDPTYAYRISTGEYQHRNDAFVAGVHDVTFSHDFMKQTYCPTAQPGQSSAGWCEGTTSAVFVDNHDYGGDYNITLDSNYLMGGNNFDAYGGDCTAAANNGTNFCQGSAPQNIVFKNNAFAPWGYSSVGTGSQVNTAHGTCVAYYYPGNTWTNNINAETKAQLPAGGC